MAMKITEECTVCGLCIDVCPTRAISEGDIYFIDPETCNECEDKKDGPRCLAACPIDCIEKA